MSTTATHTAHVYTATQAVDGGWAIEHREVPYYNAAKDHAVFQPGTLVSYPRQVFHALRVILQPKDVGKVGFGDPGKLSVVLLEDNQGQALELFRHHLRTVHRDIQASYHTALGRFTAFEGTYPAERLGVDDHIAEANSYGGILRKHGWSSGTKKDGFWYKDYTQLATNPAINGSPATMLTVDIGGKLHDFNYLPGNKVKDRMLHTWLEKVDGLIEDERAANAHGVDAESVEALGWSRCGAFGREVEAWSSDATGFEGLYLKHNVATGLWSLVFQPDSAGPEVWSLVHSGKWSFAAWLNGHVGMMGLAVGLTGERPAPPKENPVQVLESLGWAQEGKESRRWLKQGNAGAFLIGNYAPVFEAFGNHIHVHDPGTEGFADWAVRVSATAELNEGPDAGQEPTTVNWQDHPNGQPGKQARYNGYIQFRVWEHKGKHNAAVWIKFPHTDTITTSSHGTGEGFPTFGEAEKWCFNRLNEITTQSTQP